MKEDARMVLRNGREFLSIPGPTTVPDEVLSAMHRPALDIYGSEMLELTAGCLRDMRKIFRTAGQTYIYVANGHGVWEAALSNVLSRGDKVLVLESGRFAVGWGEMAKVLGCDVEVLAGVPRGAVDPAAVEVRLKADHAQSIKAVLVVQVDTASSVVNDIAAIRAAIDRAKHGALLMVDTIASLATMPFEMDEWGVDVAVSGSQKGLMVPPGLGFIAANDRAKAVHRQAGLRTSYWDWTAREGEEHYQKYCGTPPEHLLFGLRKSLDMIFAEGLENIFRRHALLAEAVRRAVERWAAEGVLEFNIVRPEQRANSVTMIRFKDGSNPAALQQYCSEMLGVVLGVALGELKGKGIRIAHMGHINAPMIMGTLSAVEIGLGALHIPHGKGGVQAAIDWLAERVPGNAR
jgi:alanine-glyoxylate transaminase / serine-glyoxylate transaminase / serine-pyruvate transaminase